MNAERVDEHVKHWVTSFFTEQVPHVEWHNCVVTQLFPLYVNPSGQSSIHLGSVGCL